MSRFLLNPCGTPGDVHPYLAIGRELRERGFDVYLITNPIYQSLAAQHALHFVPIGEPLDWLELRRDSRIHNARHAWKAAMQWGATGTMRTVFDAIQRLNRPGETVIAAPAWSLGARLAGEAMAIPLATCILNPFLLRSTRRSPVTPQMWMPDWMPRWMKGFQYWFADTFYIDPLMGKPIRQFRRELGLPKVSRWMNGWWFSPDLVLGLFNEIYVPVQDDWPCQLAFVGHPVSDPPGVPAINIEVQQFLDTGSPPICFVPGSVGPGTPHYYTAAIEACRQLGARGLILDRTEQNLKAMLPSTMHHASYSPLKDVLPKCCAIVHSGCIGTAAQGLLAGLPHVVRPCVNDQLDMAQRLARLGVANIVPSQSFSPSNLTRRLRSLFENPRLLARCREVQAIVARDHAVNSICDLLQNLLKRSRVKSVNDGHRIAQRIS